jgi:hypothetical protein
LENILTMTLGFIFFRCAIWYSPFKFTYLALASLHQCRYTTEQFLFSFCLLDFFCKFILEINTFNYSVNIGLKYFKNHFITLKEKQRLLLFLKSKFMDHVESIYFEHPKVNNQAFLESPRKSYSFIILEWITKTIRVDILNKI